MEKTNEVDKFKINTSLLPENTTLEDIEELDYETFWKAAYETFNDTEYGDFKNLYTRFKEGHTIYDFDDEGFDVPHYLRIANYQDCLFKVFGINKPIEG